MNIISEYKIIVMSTLLVAIASLATGGRLKPGKIMLDEPMDCGVHGPPPTTTEWTDITTFGILGHGWYVCYPD